MVFQKHKKTDRSRDGNSFQASQADPTSVNSVRGPNSEGGRPPRKSNWDVIEHYNTSRIYKSYLCLFRKYG